MTRKKGTGDYEVQHSGDMLEIKCSPWVSEVLTVSYSLAECWGIASSFYLQIYTKITYLGRRRWKGEEAKGERKVNKGKKDERTWVAGWKVVPVHDVLRSRWWLRSWHRDGFQWVTECLRVLVSHTPTEEKRWLLPMSSYCHFENKVKYLYLCARTLARVGASEIAQQLRVPAALSEDRSSVPTPPTGRHATAWTPAPEDLMTSVRHLYTCAQTLNKL